MDCGCDSTYFKTHERIDKIQILKGVNSMKVIEQICIVDIKCDECGKVLKGDSDKRMQVSTKVSRRKLLLCEKCFNELISEIKGVM